MSTDNQYDLRKKALSMEETDSQNVLEGGTNNGAQKSATPMQIRSVPDDKNMSAGERKKLRALHQIQGLDKKRSSHAFVATSLGDESFI